MQTIKDKIIDMKTMHKAKAEAKAEEKAEKEFAKARLDVAHEVRLAKEAEASRDLHVAKASQKVDREIAKHTGEADHSPQPGCPDSGYDPSTGGGDPCASGIDPNHSFPDIRPAEARNPSPNQLL